MISIVRRRSGWERAVAVALLATAAWVAVARAWQGEGETTDGLVLEALRNRIESAGMPLSLAVGNEPILAVETCARFYEARGFQPAWTSVDSDLHSAWDLLAAVSRARDEGLEPSDYHAELLQERLEALEGPANRLGPGSRTGALVDLELLLTDAFVLYGSHLLSGHVNPETIDPEWFAARRGGDMAATLEHALVVGDIAGALSDLAPPQPAYGRLKRALAVYRRFGAWGTIGDGPPLRVGDRGPRVVALRARLAATGDLAPSSPAGEGDESFDLVLDEAVRRFQTRHGVDVDGVVGKVTSLELNRPLAERIRQILVNLERWRWLPQSLGRRHVLVNIAGFSVQAVEDGVVVFEMRAIVGRPYRHTPVFSDRISYLVLNPSWSVPTMIAVEDKLPLIREDPDYLSKQRIKVFSGWGAEAHEVDPATVDWNAVGKGRFPFRLRQEPGPLNALGTMKFMFPNAFDIYLHDTPTRGLFAKSTRDFSSGCIRIEKPLELAEFLLASDPIWGAEALKAALAAGTEQTVRLLEPVPVHIQYWTAWVAEDGEVSFRRDLYERDNRVFNALRQTPPAP